MIYFHYGVFISASRLPSRAAAAASLPDFLHRGRLLYALFLDRPPPRFPFSFIFAGFPRILGALILPYAYRCSHIMRYRCLRGARLTLPVVMGFQVYLFPPAVTFTSSRHGSHIYLLFASASCAPATIYFALGALSAFFTVSR